MRPADLATLVSRLAAGAALMAVIGALPWLSRRDPATAILRARYAESEPTPEALAAIRQELGLADGPLITAGRWWARVLRGDLGRSWVSGHPVGPGLGDALSVSATLMAFALGTALIIATLLAVPALLRAVAGRPARSSGAVAVTLTALPEFLLANLLLILGAVHLGWFPVFGWAGPAHAVLPALALGLPAGGLLGRLFQDAISAAAAEDWVGVWRLAGARPPVMALGVLRRAAAAVIDQVGLVLVGLLGGAVAVEEIFAIPGLGRLMLGAASSLDLPALQASVLVVAAVAVLVGASFALIHRALLGGPLPDGALSLPTRGMRPHRYAGAVLAGAVGLLVAVLLAGLPRDPYGVLHPRLAPPSLQLPFGADASGRDLLARVAHGTVVTLGTATAIVLVALLASLALGFAANLMRGPIEVANSTPPIIAGILVAAVSGPSALGAAMAVLWVSWPPLAAHAAALVAEAKAVTHIRWLSLSGMSRGWIAVRHVAPMVVRPLAKHAALRLPGVALALASLGFLGLGTQPPTPEWGLILAEGMGYVERAPWATLAPTGALVLVSVAASAAVVLADSGRPRQDLRKTSGRLSPLRTRS